MLETRSRRPRKKNLERGSDLSATVRICEQVLAYIDTLICSDIWFSIFRDAVRILMLGDKLLRTIVSLWVDCGPFKQTCLMIDIVIEAFF